MSIASEKKEQLKQLWYLAQQSIPDSGDVVVASYMGDEVILAWVNRDNDLKMATRLQWRMAVRVAASLLLHSQNVLVYNEKWDQAQVVGDVLEELKRSMNDLVIESQAEINQMQAKETFGL